MTSDQALLPGEEMVREGLDDLGQDRVTDFALLVLIAAPRLRGLGLQVPERKTAEPFEHQLYARLAERLGNGAHSHYNSLIRRIVSYARAVEQERRAGGAAQSATIGKEQDLEIGNSPTRC